MNEEDTAPRKARVHIGIAIELEIANYRDAGTLMDDLQDAIEPLLGGHHKAHFAFSRFQTGPLSVLDELVPEP